MQTKDISDEQVILAADKDLSDPGSLRSTLSTLVEMTNAPEKVCLRAIERTERRGYVSCGVSTSRAFPTEEGLELLTQIDLAE